ncbi:MAG TPA: type IV pilus twitching motility protein PilT [Pyrinomonadaceae bacterium]|nr:type IV pilus twitching motility protein PilT [Pyrinomonadaceae bacterium]
MSAISANGDAREILTELLTRTIELGASDLHLRVDSPPQVRVNGKLQPLADRGVLGPDDAKRLASSFLTAEQKRQFDEKKELDFSIGLEGLSRFRVNIFNQKETVGAVYRAIPYLIRTFDDLGLPSVVADLCRKPRGLVLVTGPTGSGKSTTLATMIDRINSSRHEHILTIEDPIEFLHTHKSCVVSQRELGADTFSFAEALRSGLRQDPDVVLVGEMRDLETIEMALRVAETGHLTLATLHTNTAASTITRIIDVFPANQQPQIRTQLSNVLEGIMCQALLPNSSGTGRVMAMEILIPNSAVRNLIREDKIHQIYSMMQTGNDKFGMQTLNQSLAALYRKRDITLETALAISSNSKELLDLVGRGHASHAPFSGAAAPSQEAGGGIRPHARVRVTGAGDDHR